MILIIKLMGLMSYIIIFEKARNYTQILPKLPQDENENASELELTPKLHNITLFWTRGFHHFVQNLYLSPPSGTSGLDGFFCTEARVNFEYHFFAAFPVIGHPHIRKPALPYRSIFSYFIAILNVVALQ